jgi:hypothetical protein
MDLTVADLKRLGLEGKRRRGALLNSREKKILTWSASGAGTLALFSSGAFLGSRLWPRKR